jgi:hypothetical protein
MAETADSSANGVEAMTMDTDSTIAPVNERLLFCAEVLIGYKCEVQVCALCFVTVPCQLHGTGQLKHTAASLNKTPLLACTPCSSSMA